MSDENSALAMRGKMIGVLMKDAATVRRKSTTDCAAAVGCSPEAFEAFQSGEADACPSLPELELLAYYLEVPLSYFWGDKVLSEQEPASRPAVPADEVAALRHRIIGALVRQARQNAQMDSAELAAAVGLTSAGLAAYELGQKPIPVSELEALARRLGVPIEHFVEVHGPVGEWDNNERVLERFRQLPAELRDFVTRPVNGNYLRLAQRLSQLETSELRGIAASLLEITF
jgi:transcriptional regulator with XRE-family HTH domain